VAAALARGHLFIVISAPSAPLRLFSRAIAIVIAISAAA